MTEVSTKSTASGRALTTIDVKILKSPEEGGTKKEYEEFLNKIEDHVSINWDFGKDIAYVVKHTDKPMIDEPKDLTEAEEKIKWKQRLWNQEVDRYGSRMNVLEDNMGAMFSTIEMHLSKIMKAKVKAKEGYTLSHNTKNVVWLLKTLDDIILPHGHYKRVPLGLQTLLFPIAFYINKICPLKIHFQDTVSQ